MRIENVSIPIENITSASELLVAQLGDAGVEAVGGKKWWQWRRKDTELKAEWVEMRSDYNLRMQKKEKSNRIMLYVHGGAYFFGSVDEHRYQLQRHARKLNARVFAPRYRLAPQFPFPCGLLDCLAAYMYLLTFHDPSEIVFAGDSAGGGMILSLLCLLRDQGIDLPAGAILISPWVDLTHSFPSLSRTDKLDYIPEHGFMQKPSRSWPPPNEDELVEISKATRDAKPEEKSDGTVPQPIERVPTAEIATTARQQQPPLSLQLDGEEVFIKDQIQLYTTNQLISHPLVSPALQPSLGGLPPLLIMVGGGELLRDEQIYVAHKAADPYKYRLPERWRKLYDPEDAMLNKYTPTPVQLQVWDDLCHVAPTLSFTRPAKFMYRSVAQFGAWALSRAQKRSIEIMEDDQSSVASSSEEEEEDKPVVDEKASQISANGPYTRIGKAGDPLPRFKNNMVRQQVDRHGVVYRLPRASELPALQMESDLVGVVKEGPTRQWLAAKAVWDSKYASTRRKIQRRRVEYARTGKARGFGDGELPPPSALAGRQQDERSSSRAMRIKKSWGLGMWSSWGWKHDERTLEKDGLLEKQEAKAQPQQKLSTDGDQQMDGATVLSDDSNRRQSRARSASHASRQRRRTVTVQDEGQVEGEEPAVPTTPRAAAQNGISDTVGLTPTLAVERPTPAAANTESREPEQNLSPVFIPKWRSAAHLRGDSKDTSDAGSNYSRAANAAPDNASTMAVFSAPGVQRQDSQDDTSHRNIGTPTADRVSLESRPSTPEAKDNLGGYDTPVSRRSVERLQRHQTDITDGQSIRSSIPASILTLDGATSTRLHPLKSPSAVAIVQAEGILATPDVRLASTNELSSTVAASTMSVAAGNGGSSPDVGSGATYHDITTNPMPRGRTSSIPGGTTDQPAVPSGIVRPSLHDRDDSDFKTAHQKL